MLNVLLLHNKSNHMNQIFHNVNWKKLYVDNIYVVHDLLDFKLFIKANKIHLLIVQLDSDGKETLDVCYWLRKNSPITDFIILSENASFSHAQTAIKLGCVDYLLLPVNLNALSTSIQKACRNITQKKQILTNNTLSSLINNQLHLSLQTMVDQALSSPIEASTEFAHMKQIFKELLNNYSFFPIKFKWNEQFSLYNEATLFSFTIKNILQEFFVDLDIITVSYFYGTDELITIVAFNSSVTENDFLERMNLTVKYLTTFLNSQFTIDVGKVCYDTTPFENLQIFLFNKIKNPFVTKTELTTDKRIEQAIIYIKNNVHRPLSRTDIANELFLNEEYFSRIFQAYTSMGVKEFIVHEKITVAKKLLSQPGLSISNIASSLGYDNFSHFSKVFKKHSGMTPTEFKKSSQLLK